MKLSQENQIYSPTEKQYSDFHAIFNIQEKSGTIEQGFYRTLNKYIKYVSWIPGLRMI
jgi:hypothetical protein